MRFFTAFVLDCDRDAADPFVVAVAGNSAAEVYDSVVAHWASAKIGSGASMERATAAWNEAGACLMGILPGDHQVFWNVDGISEAALFAHGFTYDREETTADLLNRVRSLPLSEPFPLPYAEYFKSPLDAGTEWNRDQAGVWNNAIAFVIRTLTGSK